MAFKRGLIPAFLEQEGLFTRKSSSNILSDPRILEHLRHVAREAQLDEDEDNESDDSEKEHQKEELKERVAAYNKRNQGGAFRIIQSELDYEGALRFYFEAGREELTKALRLSNKTNIKELLPKLINKFNLQKDVSQCVLFVVHEADEIALDNSDCPLEIAINAVNIPRFVLRLKSKENVKEASLPTSASLPASAKQGNIDHSIFSKASDRETPFMYHSADSEHDKALNIASVVNKEPFPTAEHLTKVNKAKRTKSFLQMVRKKKGADAAESTELSTYRLAPGILKVYGDHVSPGSNYKSVRASTISTAKEVVKQALEKYAIECSNPSKFVLCDVVGHFKVGKEGKEGQDYEEEQWVTEYMRIVNDNEKPLVVQSLWKPAAGRLRRFELIERSQLDVGCFFINTAENIRKTSNLSSPNIDSERSSILSEQATNEPVATDTLNSNSKGNYRYASSEQPQSFNQKIPYLLLIKGFNAVSDQLVYPLGKPNILIGNSPLEGVSDKPDICLVAPDIAEAHCYIHKKISQGRGTYDTNIDDVKVSVFIEPVAGSHIDINGVKIEQLTMLTPGQLVSFGCEYCFIFKDPSQIEDKALKLTWLDSLKQTIRQGKQKKHSQGINNSLETEIDEVDSGETDHGSGMNNPAIVVSKHGESSKTKVKRSPVMLTYEYDHEDELLDKIVHILGLKSFKLTPAYLLVMMIEHSCATFDDIRVRKLLLKVSSALQSIAWEKTKDIGKNNAERKNNVGEFFDEMLQDLAAVVTWMANSLEMLHFLQCHLNSLMQTVHLSQTAVRDSLVSADEELLTVLEEVIMFTFQQTVYHLTKVLYSSLPAILDANPFQSENGDEDEETVSVPPGVSFIIGIYGKVFSLVQTHMVHPQIITQLFEYLFFFTNASLFNSLMERGAGGKFYRWTKGVQIRGNLDVLEEFANRNGLQDQFSAHMKKIVAAIALLSIPKAQLMSMDWLAIRDEFPDLNASQVQQLLGEYQLNGKSRPRGWYPPPEEVEAALRTSDVLESFATHPPLLLPSTDFQLDLNNHPNDREFANCLVDLNQDFGSTKESFAANGRMNVATQSARGIENPKDIIDELPNMTSTPQHHNKKGITDGIETNNNNFKSQLIMDFEENSESMSKKDSTSKQMSETKSETTVPKSYNDLGTKNDINENKSAVGSMIPNDSKGGTDGISRSNVVLAESKRQQLSENKQSSNVDESDVCDVDFTSNYVDLAKSIDPTNNPNNVTVVDLVRGDKGLGLGLIDGLITPLASPGIYIRTIVANSPAAKDGRIKLGDRILAVNGNSLVGCDYARAMDMIIHAGAELSFLVAKSDRLTSDKVLSSQC